MPPRQKVTIVSKIALMNYKLLTYSTFALAFYFVIAAAIGFFYSFYASMIGYLQPNAFSVVLNSLIFSIPYVVFGAVLALPIRRSNKASFRPSRMISLWATLLIAIALILTISDSTPEVVDSTGTIGSRKAILEFIWLWLGGISSGLFVFRWLSADDNFEEITYAEQSKAQ